MDTGIGTDFKMEVNSRGISLLTSESGNIRGETLTRRYVRITDERLGRDVLYCSKRL